MADLSRISSYDGSVDDSGVERREIFSGTSGDGSPSFISASSDDVIKVKVVVVGDMAVGKTSLAVRFTKNKFDDKYMQTVGASFYVRAVEIKGKKVIFQIWDTAGQERFRSLVPMYLRDTGIALLVYDVTDKNSFYSVENWLKELRMSAPEDAILALIGNKADLVTSIAVNAKAGEDFANEKGMKFYETSAKTGKNIEFLFNELALAVLESSSTRARNDSTVDIEQPSEQKRSHKCCH